jgi:hypothetical protein
MTESGMARDASILALTGTSQLALPLNGNRQFLVVENVGAAVIGVNYSGPGAAGNPAILGGSGTETIAPNEKRTFDDWVPQNAVAVVGTIGASVVVIEG